MNINLNYGGKIMDEVDFYLMDLESKFKKIDPNKYYLSYSGGKDSHFLLWFIKEYLHDDKIQIISVNTFMEHNQILKRMKKYADIVLIPDMNPRQIKEKYGIPCFSKSQDKFIYYFQEGSKAPSVLKRVYGTEQSWFNLSKKARNYVLSGSAHKISPYCCDILKKKPLKKYERQNGRKPILGVRGGRVNYVEQCIKVVSLKVVNLFPYMI